MSFSNQTIVNNCQRIIDAYNQGLLGTYAPAESIAPLFQNPEDRLRYYTLPMAINYRRPSEQLWNAAQKSYADNETYILYNLSYIAGASLTEIQHLLSVYKLAMQPTRHTLTWQKIGTTIHNEWGSVENLLETVDFDFLILKEIIQHTHKKDFPYLSGPKIFNFWSYILSTRCDVNFRNKEYIDIAVDSHIIKSSVQLGVVTIHELKTMTSEQIAARWRVVLKDSEIAPVDLNIPLWYWSRNGLRFTNDTTSLVFNG
jgi:hypothetical protein